MLLKLGHQSHKHALCCARRKAGDALAVSERPLRLTPAAMSGSGSPGRHCQLGPEPGQPTALRPPALPCPFLAAASGPPPPGLWGGARDTQAADGGCEGRQGDGLSAGHSWEQRWHVATPVVVCRVPGLGLRPWDEARVFLGHV